MPRIDPWITVFSALSAGGGFKLAYDGIRVWHNRIPKEMRKTDASIATVVRARDELEADNTRLRTEREEDRVRHAAERAEWQNERSILRADIARLEAQIRLEREQAAARYDSLLEHVHSLQRRTLGEEPT
jgi:septal ring factor EnvC (AmiA/AmiB activator)